MSSYKLEFIPLEDDLVSLEYENVFKEIWLVSPEFPCFYAERVSHFLIQDGDDTSIFYAASALITIQQAYGLFPRIVGKGDAAKVRTFRHLAFGQLLSYTRN